MSISSHEVFGTSLQFLSSNSRKKDGTWDPNKAIDPRTKEEKMQDLLLQIPGPVAYRGDMQLDDDGNYWLFTEDGLWTQITKDANPDPNWKMQQKKKPLGE